MSDSEPTPDPAPEWNYHAAVAPDGAFSEGWTEHLPDEYKDGAATAAKYKTLPELVKAHYSATKKVMEKNDRPFVPGDGASEKDVARYRKALGLPDSPDEYSMRPDEVPEENWDKDTAKGFEQLLYENNVPPAAAKALAAKYVEFQSEAATLAEAQAAARTEENMASLRAKYGEETTQQLDYARRMALTAGVDPNDPAFSEPAVIEALAYAGRNMREDRLISREEGASNSASGAKALATDIMTNSENPDYKKYWEGDPEVKKRVYELNSRAARLS